MNEDHWLSASDVVSAVWASIHVLESHEARLKIVLQCKPWYKRLFMGQKGPWWRRTKVPPSYRERLFWIRPTIYRLYRLAAEADEAIRFLESSTILVSEDDFLDIKDQYRRMK